MSFKYSTECFSGECGFCQSCNDKPFNNQHHQKIKTEENKATDFKKFFNKEELQKEYEIYLSSLNKSLKNYQFVDKKEQGFIPKELIINSSKYKLINSSHKCNSILCQMFYLHLHDNIKNKLIESTPIYKSETDKNFCILCLSR